MLTQLSKILLVSALLGSSYAEAQVSKTSIIRGQLTTIMEFGLAGGALGLSTLSFYGKPQAKLTHIPIGLALGIFVGAIYSTTQVVTNPGSLVSQVEPVSLDPAPAPPPPLAFQWTVDF